MSCMWVIHQQVDDSIEQLSDGAPCYRVITLLAQNPDTLGHDNLPGPLIS